MVIITLSPLDVSITEWVAGILRYRSSAIVHSSRLTVVVRATPALTAQVSVPPSSSATGWGTGWRRRTSAQEQPTLPLILPNHPLCPLRSRREGRRWSATTAPGLSTGRAMASLISTTLILISALTSTTGGIFLSLFPLIPYINDRSLSRFANMNNITWEIVAYDPWFDLGK